jgi:hypothetical protein
MPSAACRSAPAIRPASSAPKGDAATCRPCTRTASCRTSAPTVKDASLAPSATARPGQRLEIRRQRQPRPQRARFPRAEFDQRQLLVRAETGRRHLRRIAARSRHRHAEIPQTTFNADLRGPLEFGGRKISWPPASNTAATTTDRGRRPGLLPVRPHQQPGHRDPRPDRRHRRLRAQGFPGYTPATAVDDGTPQHRAVLLDAEHNLTDSCCWPRRALRKILGLRQHHHRQAEHALRPDAKWSACAAACRPASARRACSRSSTARSRPT